MDQWTMRQSSLELQLMIKQSTNNASSFSPVHSASFLFQRSMCEFVLCGLSLIIVNSLFSPTGALLAVGEYSQGNH